MLLIGLDAASQRERFGFAVGRLESGAIQVLNAGLLAGPRDAPSPMEQVACYLREAPYGVIAIDAPLGWPVSMGTALSSHGAGAAIPVHKDQLFRRLTERRLRHLKIAQPLEVGADRIARAAHEALRVLDDLREASGRTIPLAWKLPITEWSVIEAYPAATLKAHRLVASGYKKSGQRERRKQIAQSLAHTLPDLDNLADQASDVFDAALCLLSAKDFLEGSAPGPDTGEQETARKEGWIWVRHAN